MLVTMFDRLRKALGSRDEAPASAGANQLAQQKTPADVTKSTGANSLPEGVYANYGHLVHYVADGKAKPMCGGAAKDLWRWSSAWYLVESDRRCKRCDGLVGDRGNQAHGLPTELDMFVLGIEPPATMPEADRARIRETYEEGRRRDEAIVLKAAAFAAPPGTTFSDPPYVYAKNPARPRTSGESAFDRVINDVYTKTRNGKKWHRIYETHRPSQEPYLAPYGRSLLFPCGNAGSDFDRDDKGEFYAPPIRTDVPVPEEICRGCAQSDAKYGKGDIRNVSRWDH
jgi:hypothetical protein